MSVLNDLLLISGNDIPFTSGCINIHQPTIKEIGYIGEEEFHIGTRFLLFNKNDLVLEDKSDLDNRSNFDIFMSVMNSRQAAKHKTDAIMVLTLMFPNSEIKIEKDKILLQQENINVKSSINQFNFEEFQNIVRQIFCINEENAEGGSGYNPADGLAKKIADRFKKRKQILSKTNGEKKINIFSRYASILSIGLQKNIFDLMNYTVYQLFDEFKRYQMKQEFDIYIQAKVAGAQDLEEVKNWMEDIHT